MNTVAQENPIIVALDGRGWNILLPVLTQLYGTGCGFKANDLAAQKGTEWILPRLSHFGKVMLDFKTHDIPNTATNTARHFLAYPPWAVTVHASGGEKMVTAAVKMLEDTPTKVLAVTVLTSLKDECREIYGREPMEQVEVLAKIARRGGAHGFVSSAEEVGMLRSMYSDATLVVPAVRSPGKDAEDQKRVGTPAKAMKDGASNIVMGRQIIEAPDPVVELNRVLTEELGITPQKGV